jgi:RNA polymerase sigma factor (sigma-70 family)
VSLGIEPDDPVLRLLSLAEPIERFLRRRERLSSDEAEEFHSYLRLKLVERGRAILDGFRGRSTLETYLSVVVQRLFLDHRAESSRKWPASIVGGSGPELDTIPAAPREDPVSIRENQASARKLESALDRALDGLDAEDGALVRLHFREGLPLSSVATLLGLPAKPLYRRVERLLAGLRARLEAEGIEARLVRSLLGRPEFGVGWNEARPEVGNGETSPSKDA